MTHPAIYSSSDGGLTWVASGFTQSLASDLACDPGSDQVIYLAASLGERLWRSSDGGLSFSPFNDGLELAGRPADLHIPAGLSAPRLLLSTSRGGFSNSLPVPLFDDGFENGDTTAWSAVQF